MTDVVIVDGNDRIHIFIDDGRDEIVQFTVGASVKRKKYSMEIRDKLLRVVAMLTG